MQWRVFWSNGCPLEPVKSIPIERFKRTPEEIKSKKEIFSSKTELSYIERDILFEIGIFSCKLLLFVLLYFWAFKDSINFE